MIRRRHRPTNANQNILLNVGNVVSDRGIASDMPDEKSFIESFVVIRRD